MSAYENVVAGKLRLKGKALNVRGGSISRKKKKHEDANNALDENETNVQNGEKDQDGRLTPAERCYLERWQKIELQRVYQAAKKPHRDRIREFNQYLANLREHYGIPKVGPG